MSRKDLPAKPGPGEDVPIDAPVDGRAEVPIADPRPADPRPALAALTPCVFAVGTAEYVIVGLLPSLSAGLRVPLPTAGLLVTCYAAAVTVCGPVMTALTLRWPRRPALLTLMAVFTVANVAAALAGGFGTLVAARAVIALTHSTSFAIALVMAVAMVPEGRRGRAIAVVSAGWNLAGVLGTPLGTWIGHEHGWRATFWAITAVGVVAFAGVAAFARPSRGEVPRPSRPEAAALRERRVLALLMIIVLCQVGLFTFYTYVSPVLTGVTGFGPAAVTVLLGVVGAGTLAGNALGGALADRFPWAGLRCLLAALAATLAGLAVAGHSKPATAAGLFALGVFSSALIPLLQDRALAAAPLAPTLVTATAASAINLGIAGGSFLGGRVFDAGPGPASLPWIGALPVLAALAVTIGTARAGGARRRPRRRERAGRAPAGR